MPVATDTSQLELIKALLAQKGLLATGGQFRPVPFDYAAAAAGNGVGANGSTPSTNGADAVRPEGPMPLVGPDNTLIDPTTQQPLTPEASSDWWKYLLGAAGVAGGVALADALRRRMGSRVSLVEGEVIDPLGPVPVGESEIVPGEFTEVNQPRLTQQPAPLNEPTAATALAERQKQLPSRTRPRANPQATSDTSVVRLPDAMNDITPEELANARALARQLVQNRLRGNKQRANTGNLTRRAGPPTGPADEETLLKTIIRLMRESGATRVLPRAIP